MWSHNNADEGGAVYVFESSDVSWPGETTWSQNHAERSGVAVFLQRSSVSWNGETIRSNNTAGEVGGTLNAQSSNISMTSSSLFEYNTAGAGGAVTLSSVVIGPEFIRITFNANEAPRRGAVYSVSSGIEIDNVGIPLFPAVYEDCLFREPGEHRIESAAGNDYFVDSVFERNTAGVGGALRLRGSAVLANCIFVDNTAEDEGPAISNLGVLDTEGNSSRFSVNILSCEKGTYLDDADGSRYETVCDGCPGSNSDWIVSVENKDRVPICVVQLEHTRSVGGDTAIQR